MHECISNSALLANAEVDSMRGVIDSGVDTRIKTSPCQIEIEKVQEEIRLEVDCREERLRELEFLKKGGDPLDFNFGHAASVSVQSTSLKDQHPEQIVTSKEKEYCASTALRLRHGETVESVGKDGDTTCEANSGNNILIADGDNKVVKDKNYKSRGSKSNLAISDYSTRSGGTHKAKGTVYSAIFRPYARRNRSKSNCDGARSASMDVAHPHSNQLSTHLRTGTRDVKGPLSEANSKDQQLSSICILKSLDSISYEVHNNDSIRKVESAGLQTEDKLSNALNEDRKEHELYAKTNGDFFGNRRDFEKTRDSACCSADIEAEERTALTICASLPSDATTTTQHKEISCQPDGLEISNKMNCTQNYGDKSAGWVNEDTNEKHGESVLVFGEANKLATENPLEIKIHLKLLDYDSVDIGAINTDNDSKNYLVVKVDEDLGNKRVTPETSMSNKLKETEVVDVHKNHDNLIHHNCNPLDFETAGVSTFTKTPSDEISDTIASGRDANDEDIADAEARNCKLTETMDEDSILAQAKIIQAKRKKIAELSERTLPLVNGPKSHWDFLLEEMAWLANDFMQERLWKITAAAQISRQTAMSSHLRDEKQMPVRRLKLVAHSLAKAVMKFWHSSELLVTNSSNSSSGIITPGEPALSDSQSPCKEFALKNYALRFLRYNNSIVPFAEVEDEEPIISNYVDDLDAREASGESCITEDELFYAISPGIMACYRTSIESYVSQCEKNASIQNADDTTMHDVNEEMSQENGYDEDEGETCTQYIPRTVEWSRASDFPHKKHEGLKRTYTSESYDMGLDLAYGSHTSGSQKSVLLAKRPASQNVVSIPTKRMRTASRQRVLGSSSGVGTGNMLGMNRADDSSGDTNSYQDDQGSVHGGSQVLRSLEVESAVDFRKYLPIDSGEISTKRKKKKQAKNMSSSYEQRWLHESEILGDIGDHSKRRLDSHHLDSNGSHGSMPSPAASQMSNMPYANEYKKVITNRDRLRQSKVTKLPISISGSGSAWTSFEEQALVVLVHDMGPNWELVSDAINSTLQFKRIFRGPKECKEKHKMLMDQTAGDGADSADDSGPSQPYPSTMPGIPKGRARQLFQRLRAPLEPDTVKCHFEKIIMIGRKHHHRIKQCDSRDPKRVTHPHNSHVIAVSQVSVNNLNGGCFTPLDHIDAIMSSADALALEYQSPQTSGFVNQSSVPSVLPPPGPNSMYQGSVGNSLSSPSGPLSHSHRNGRYSVPRTSPPIDDQQKIQQLNPLFSGGNIQQSTMPVAEPHLLGDCFGARKLHGGNVMGMVNGINNRGMPISRPGFQGLGSSATLDSAAAFLPGRVVKPSLEMQSLIGSNQGNTMPRPLDKSHQSLAGQSLEHHREMMVPELQMRATLANSNCIAPTINGLNASYTSQAGPSSAQSYPVHSLQKHQMSLQQSHDLTDPHHAHLRGPNHAIGSKNPAYARLVEERRHQQMLQHQQQFSASQAVSHSSLSSSSPMMPVYSQLQQKHHLPPHGGLRDTQSGNSNLPSHVLKQRQRHLQHQQQSVRVDTAQQRQQLQSQQHGIQLQGEGKGNMVMSVTADQPIMNGQSPSPVSQSTDKLEQDVGMHGSQNSV